MAQNNPELPRITRNGSEWPRIARNGLEWSRMARNVQECPGMAQNGDFSSNFGSDFYFVKLCASPSDNLISLSYPMPVFSANSFGLFFENFLIIQFYLHTKHQ